MPRSTTSVTAPSSTTLYRLVLDGVYRRGTEGEPVFVEVPAPTDDARHAVLHKIITRTMKLLTRRGVLIEEQGQTYLADNDGDSDEARTLRPLQAAAQTMDAQPILLRLPMVMRITGLARSTIYKLISQNQFPVPIKLSERAVAWLQSEIESWVSSRVRAH